MWLHCAEDELFEMMNDALKNGKTFELSTDTAASEISIIIQYSRFSLWAPPDGQQWSVIILKPAFHEIYLKKLLKTSI